MPIYEYECKSCHHHFDLMQKITEPPLTQCPQCLNDTAVRLISAAGFQLKGSGWYATDFKHKGNKPSEDKKDTPPASTDTKAADKKGEKA